MDDIKVTNGRFAALEGELFTPSVARSKKGWAQVVDAEIADELLRALVWAATVIRPGTDLRNTMDAAIARATTVAG